MQRERPGEWISLEASPPVPDGWRHDFPQQPKAVTQSLHPAQHGRIPAVLPRPKLERLHKLADQHLSLPGQRPLRLADQFALGSSPRERYRAAGFQAMLSAAKPWLEATLGPRWLVLAGKVLLRHTWPLAEEMA